MLLQAVNFTGYRLIRRTLSSLGVLRLVFTNDGIGSRADRNQKCRTLGSSKNSVLILLIQLMTPLFTMK